MKKNIKKFLLLSVFIALCTPALAQTAADTSFDENAAITDPQQYLIKAREYYQLAQDNYAKGEYDISADYAKKAREYAENYRNAVKLSSQYNLSLNRIKEAEALIATARSMGATDADLQPSIDKLNDARTQVQNKTYELAVNSAEESINLTKDLISRLKDKSKTSGTENKFWKTYKVRLIPEQRDCLWRIAGYDFIYSNPQRWPVIWKENKDQIIDPDLIYPDQMFRIPKLDATAEAGTK